ncbi:hypothetical protein MMC07_000630 [Pseudocyphellaria aurata]|nr:hypothetical protein [Pseudocyphellaria aurata]
MSQSPPATDNHSDHSNFDIFRDCVSGPIIQKLLIAPAKPSKRKTARERKNPAASLSATDEPIAEDNGDDFAEFVDYIATETFFSLPPDLQTLSYPATQSDPTLARKYTDPLSPVALELVLSAIPVSVLDSLQTYSLLADPSCLAKFFTPIINSYISSAIAPPAPWSSTRASACEICGRGWINLTYHHLIPKQVHAKVIKRGWHEEWRLNSVAWLCGACHRFVHRMAGNEQLAKEWWTVERLLSREDVKAWASWVGKVRWKAK